MKGFVVTIVLIFSLGVFGIVIVKNVQLKQNCTGYLKRAADANSVEMAKSQLEKALKYIEENNLTAGYTSVLWKTPDEDIEFWYNNIKTSYDELSKVDENTSSLEKSNILMKLRETLIDNGEKGDNLTYPDGLSRYPNNALWGILRITAGLFLFAIILWVYVELDN